MKKILSLKNRYCILFLISSLLVLTNCSTVPPLPEPKCNSIDKVVNSENTEIAPFIYNNELFFTRIINNVNENKVKLEKNEFLRKSENYILVCKIYDSCITKEVGCCTEKYDFGNSFGKSNLFFHRNRENIYSLIQGGCYIQNDIIYFSGYNSLNSERLDIYYLPLNASTPPQLFPKINTSKSWEAHPTMNDESDLIIFTSDRSGINQLWYSTKYNNDWSEPEQLMIKGFESCDVETPHIFQNKLFFSSNLKGNYDIYEIEFKLSSDKKVILDPKSIKSVEDVNTSADEKYPFYHRQYSNLFYASNYGKDAKDFDIKYRPYVKKGKTIIVAEGKVIKKDADGNIIRTLDKNVGFNLKILKTNCPDDKIKELGKNKWQLPAESEVELIVDVTLENNPCTKREEMELILIRNYGTEHENREVVKNAKSFKVKTSCKDEEIAVVVEITEYLYNIVTYNISSDLRFFVTGYWRPSISINKSHFLYGKRQDNFTKTSVHLSEFKDLSSTIRTNDSTFNILMKNFEEIINKSAQCPDIYVKIGVYGFTDRRGLLGDYVYNGTQIHVGFDINGEQYTINKNHPNSIEANLRGFGQGGNIVLSKLRAYYTFISIDKLLENNPNWHKLKNEGRIICDFEGFGIDNSQGTNYAENRHSKIQVSFGKKDEIVDTYSYTLNNILLLQNIENKKYRQIRTIVGFNKEVDLSNYDDDFYKQMGFTYSYYVHSNNYDLFQNKSVEELNNIIETVNIFEIGNSLFFGKWSTTKDAKKYLEDMKGVFRKVSNEINSLNPRILDPNTYYSIHIFSTSDSNRCEKVYNILKKEFNLNEIVISKTNNPKEPTWRIRTELFTTKSDALNFFNYLYDLFLIEKFELFDLRIFEMKDESYITKASKGESEQTK